MSIEAITLGPAVGSTLGESFAMNLSPDIFSGYRHKKRAVGGNYRASFSVAMPFHEMFWFFSRNLKRDVQVFNHRGIGVWDGFIFGMELAMGNMVLSVSLQPMANRMWSRYYNGSDTVRSTTFEDAVSRSKYGPREQVRGLGETTLALANQSVRTLLERVKDPSIPAVSWSGSASGPAILSVDCRGYWDLFWWQVYNQTASSGAIPASDLIGNIIDATGDHVLVREIQDNFTGVEQEIDSDRWAGDFITSIAGVGDDLIRRWVAGMSFGRKFYYRQSAQSALPEH